MRIAVLTSSRADYGIYMPLLRRIEADPFFSLEIIAFGTHLSKGHGYTLDKIEQDNYSTIHKVSSLVSNDDEQGIATSYGLTVLKFADFWKSHVYDLVLCLGDRFEMSAAVQAGIPYNIKFAHIHGGETTLGAIDNIYRHQISLASKIHFTATEEFSKKVGYLLGTTDCIHTVGSLSLDSIETFKPIDKGIFLEKFGIVDTEFALATFHPETVNIDLNIHFAKEMRRALASISKNIFVVITMPNADTMGSIYREQIYALREQYPDKILCIENFGKDNYFNAMYHAKIMIGNTSSGIIEAASFGKYVVNIGERQKGRVQSGNVIESTFSEEKIVRASQKAITLGEFKGENIYFRENTVDLVIDKLKKYYETI